jgi:hypothetical protein
MNTGNERSGRSRLKLGIWRLKGIRTRYKEASCILCLEDEDDKHIVIKCMEIIIWN